MKYQYWYVKLLYEKLSKTQKFFLPLIDIIIIFLQNLNPLFILKYKIFNRLKWMRHIKSIIILLNIKIKKYIKLIQIFKI